MASESSRGYPPGQGRILRWWQALLRSICALIFSSRRVAPKEADPVEFMHACLAGDFAQAQRIFDSARIISEGGTTQEDLLVFSPPYSQDANVAVLAARDSKLDVLEFVLQLAGRHPPLAYRVPLAHEVLVTGNAEAFEVLRRSPGWNPMSLEKLVLAVETFPATGPLEELLETWKHSFFCDTFSPRRLANLGHARHLVLYHRAFLAHANHFLATIKLSELFEAHSWLWCPESADLLWRTFLAHRTLVCTHTALCPLLPDHRLLVFDMLHHLHQNVVDHQLHLYMTLEMRALYSHTAQHQQLLEIIAAARRPRNQTAREMCQKHQLSTRGARLFCLVLMLQEKFLLSSSLTGMAGHCALLSTGSESARVQNFFVERQIKTGTRVGLGMNWQVRN